MNRSRWSALIVLVIALFVTVAAIGATVLWHTWSPEKKEVVQTFWIPDGAEVIPRTDVNLRGDNATVPVEDIKKELSQGGAAESLLVMPMPRHPDTKQPAVRYKLYRLNQVALDGLEHMASVDEPPRL